MSRQSNRNILRLRTLKKIQYTFPPDRFEIRAWASSNFRGVKAPQFCSWVNNVKVVKGVSHVQEVQAKIIIIHAVQRDWYMCDLGRYSCALLFGAFQSRRDATNLSDVAMLHDFHHNVEALSLTSRV